MRTTGHGAVSLFPRFNHALSPVISLFNSSYLVLPVQNLVPSAVPAKNPATTPLSLSSHSVFE